MSLGNLPSELDLARRLNVSRMTIGKTLRYLENRGLKEAAVVVACVRVAFLALFMLVMQAGPVARNRV